MLNLCAELEHRLVDSLVRASYNTHMMNTKPKLVQDRRTGEWYDPEQRFRELLNDQLVQATLKRLADR